ncbi:ComF family protein [Sphingomonas sp. CLY1604]|uniref:ComF family protein n=1 Tax=Sphingomonas sp. CLY1604 TaxID=3457786 RepID=UPI003FD88DE5
MGRNGAGRRLAAWVGRAAGHIAALALPPRCPGCGMPVAADHRFCATCWSGLRLIAPPWCAGCNLPFAHDRGEGARCGACLADPPRHAGVRAAVAYGAVARRLALKLKYGGRIGVAATMAERIAPTVPRHLDLLVPVPLHRWRLWSRGYNQAALIAAALRRRTGIDHDPLVLVRRRRTVVLQGLGSRGRRRAVAGAFAVTGAARVRGRSIGLVDDVYTSGATAAACTRALLAAGAASVTILCWARVIPGEDDAAADGGTSTALD